MTNISITNSKNNVGAYINDINLKNLDQDKVEEIKKALFKASNPDFDPVVVKEEGLYPKSNFKQPTTYSVKEGVESDAESDADVDNPETDTKREDIRRDVKITVEEFNLGAGSEL